MQQLSPFHLLILMGLTQALFLAFVLLRRLHKQHGERWLIALLLLLACEMAFQIYYETGLYHAAPWLIGLDSATFLLYGPLLWLFLRRMAQEPLPRRVILGLHFVPAALLQWNAFAYFVMNPDQVDFIGQLDTFRQDGISVWDPVQFVQELLIGAYLFACWRVWRRYRINVEAERAQWQHSGLDWMRQVLQVFSFLWILVLARDQVLIWWEADKAVDHLISIALPTTIFYLAYRLWQQTPAPLVLAQPVSSAPAPVQMPHQPDPGDIPGVPEGLPSPSPNDAPAAPVGPGTPAIPAAQPVESPNARKYAKSALDDSSTASIYDTLEALMREAEPWRESELDLAGLASRLELSPHYVSQAINSRAQCNFYDYINRYRILSVQQSLADPDHGNILDLAFAAGFNSKSAFYTAFKRHTGSTPSAYRQQRLKQGSPQ